MIKACIFDLDGTLADTMDTIVYFANAALKEQGLPQIEKTRFNALVGNGMDELIKGMLRIVKPDYTEADFTAVRHTFHTRYNADFMYLTKPFEGVSDLLGHLKLVGIKLAILSNKPHYAVTGVVKGLFGDGLFDRVMGQREGIARKPSPEGALCIAKEFNLPPGEVLFIGDSDVDILTGRNAGMKTAGVLWGFRTQKELSDNGAVYIVSRPEELFGIVTGQNAEP